MKSRALKGDGATGVSSGGVAVVATMGGRFLRALKSRLVAGVLIKYVVDFKILYFCLSY
jgi:hypothetical protein